MPLDKQIRSSQETQFSYESVQLGSHVSRLSSQTITSRNVRETERCTVTICWVLSMTHVTRNLSNSACNWQLTAGGSFTKHKSV